MDSARLQPALYGGLLIGVLSALPFVSAGGSSLLMNLLGTGVLLNVSQHASSEA